MIFGRIRRPVFVRLRNPLSLFPVTLNRQTKQERDSLYLELEMIRNDREEEVTTLQEVHGKETEELRA